MTMPSFVSFAGTKLLTVCVAKSSCIVVLVYIVDNLKLTEIEEIEDKKCPRINQYTMETLMSTIGKAKCHHGRISFDNFKLKAIEETCYAESSRLHIQSIQSPVDSQHSVSAVVTSGVPIETQMPMPMRLPHQAHEPMPVQLLHQVHGILSAVQPVAQSIGIDPKALDECIAGLALQRAHGLLSAVQPLASSIGIDPEAVGECIDEIAQYGAVNTGLARSDAGAVNTEISGSAVEDAEAAKTKKATVQTSCSFSDRVIGNPTTEISGTEAAKTKKATGRAQKSGPTKNVAEVGSKNPAGENAAESNPAAPTSCCTTRSMSRLPVLKHKGKVVGSYDALAGGDESSSGEIPARPTRKQVKKKQKKEVIQLESVMGCWDCRV